ncbi:MAG: glycosyl transferase [Gammaproteobacteria bacterium]|nr:glycosyl transferase [Gammaproteobacteria bacterium]
MYEREENPRNVTKADLVVGLASYMEADNIDYPTAQADKGLKQYYGDKSSVIVNCDNASPDGTEQVFLGTTTETPKIYITTPPDTPGKGYNFENMFRKLLELDGEALVCIDSDLESVTPKWVKYLAEPVMEGYDFVAPLYSRHKYDGTITNNLTFPLVYGLLGKNIRQPIGGDFALSKRFAEHLVCQPWHRTTEEYGVDIFMTLNAVLGGFKCCNTGLGAKIHKPSAPKLGQMFIQVVSTAFLTIIKNVHLWKEVSEVEQQKLFGLQELDKPQDLTIDREAIEKQARIGFFQSQSCLEKVLSADLYSHYVKMFEDGPIEITAEEWATTVYDMISAYKSMGNMISVIESLKGLYFGRALTFMNQTWKMSSEKAEKEILAQAEIFFQQRDYLIKKIDN